MITLCSRKGLKYWQECSRRASVNCRPPAEGGAGHEGLLASDLVSSTGGGVGQVKGHSSLQLSTHRLEQWYMGHECTHTPAVQKHLATRVHVYVLYTCIYCMCKQQQVWAPQPLWGIDGLAAPKGDGVRGSLCFRFGGALFMLWIMGNTSDCLCIKVIHYLVHFTFFLFREHGLPLPFKLISVYFLAASFSYSTAWTSKSNSNTPWYVLHNDRHTFKKTTTFFARKDRTNSHYFHENILGVQCYERRWCFPPSMTKHWSSMHCVRKIAVKHCFFPESYCGGERPIITRAGKHGAGGGRVRVLALLLTSPFLPAGGLIEECKSQDNLSQRQIRANRCSIGSFWRWHRTSLNRVKGW